MGNLRFWLVFQISRYTIDQSKLGIAKIEADDKIQIFKFASLNGVEDCFGTISGGKLKPVDPCFLVPTKMFFMLPIKPSRSCLILICNYHEKNVYGRYINIWKRCYYHFSQNVSEIKRNIRW